MNTKKIILISALISTLFFLRADALTVLFPTGGGTGTSTKPTAGQVLVGQSNGTYAPQATSTLGLGGSGITTTTGDWAGTWQGVSSSTFYLVSNPDGYIAASGVPGAETDPIYSANTYAIAMDQSVSIGASPDFAGLMGTGGNVAIDPRNKYLYDGGPAMAMDWHNRYLYGSAGQAPTSIALSWTDPTNITIPQYTTDGLLKVSGGGGTIGIASVGTDYISSESDPIYSGNTYATGMNQGVATTDSPSFTNITASTLSLGNTSNSTPLDVEGVITTRSAASDSPLSPTEGLRMSQSGESGTNRFSNSIYNSVTLADTPSNSVMQFRVGTSEYAQNTVMSLFGDGRVGIGTTTPTSLLTLQNDSLGATIGTMSTSGIALVNTTAAANGAQQMSPAIRWTSNGWKTTGTASVPTNWQAYNLPVQGSTNPTSNWILGFTTSTGPYVPKFTLTSGGALTITGALTTNGTLTTGGAITMSGALAGGTTGAFSTSVTTPALINTGTPINIFNTHLGTQIFNFANATSTATSTKIMNIGTAGLGTTTIAIGSASGNSVTTLNGKVGIGTSTPATALVVNGTSTLTQGIIFGDSTSQTTAGVTKATNIKSIQWSAAYTSSTQAFDDPIFTFQATSTIQKVYVSSRDAANTLNWNFVYGTDPTTATSSAFKLFSSTQNTTSTPGSAKLLTSFASSTPGAGQTLRLYSDTASSTLTSFTLYYTEN